MSRFPDLMLSAALALIAGGAVAQDSALPVPAELSLDQLGRTATDAEIAAWDIDIRPDGMGLPPGEGSVAEGEVIYTESCASCHGDFGEGRGRWPVLAGGADTLTADRPVKTIGSYWPYLSTVYDYVHRAMPFGDAQSLSDDQVYAITAYLLFLNWEVEDDFVLSNENFTEARLPNEEGFGPDDRPEVELPLFSGEVCMTDCKDSVEITGRAAVVNVTPGDGSGGKAEAEAAGAPEADASAEPDTDAAAEPDADTASDVLEPDTAEAQPAVDPELVAAGEKVFRKCKACHQVGDGAKNRSGPHLNGVFGRVAGTIDGFRYSSAMKDAGEGGLVWNSETLAGFLAKPRSYLKGTKMSFPGLRSPEDISAIEAYLRATSE